MSYVALYRAYRSQNFNEISGQEHIKKTLQNAVFLNKIAHAYLFSGPRGTGKTSMAKIFAKAVNCLNPHDGEPCNKCENCLGINRGVIADVIEIDAASNNGVDEIRELRERVKYLPSTCNRKVYIIDEIHMLTPAAFNALLKTLEEPPAHVIFVLATTEPHKIPPTILSRCQRFDFKSLSLKDLKERLRMICEQEKQKISDEAVQIIAEYAEGGMRDAISLLDQAISFAADEVTAEDVNTVSGNVSTDHILKVACAIYEQKPEKVLEELDHIIDSGKEITRIATDLISFYRDALLYKTNYYEDKVIYKNPLFAHFIGKVSNQKIYYCLQVLNESQNNMRWTSQKRPFFEMSLLKMSDYQENIPLDNEMRIMQLQRKIDELASEIKKNPVIKHVPENISVATNAPMENIKYLTSEMIEDVLNNGNKERKNELQKLWHRLNDITTSRLILKIFTSGRLVACSDSIFIITLDSASHCEQLSRVEEKKIILKAISSLEMDFENFYAIPQNVWEGVLADFLSQHKKGINKPKLSELTTQIRIYDLLEEKDALEEHLVGLFGDKIVKVE